MVYRLMPNSYKERIEEWLMFAGSKKSPKGFVNYVFSFSFSISFLLALFINMLIPLPGILFVSLWVLIFLSMFALFHGFLIIIIDKRAGSVEKILPDALQLMAANSRAGYIPSRALLMSARPEFGILSESIKTAGKEMMAGKCLKDSIEYIHKNIKSDMLKRTLKLISEGIRSGGHFASLLEENADDIRRVQIIKKEMRANVMLYIIFIFFAGAICAPLLYALSGFLIETIGGFGAMAQVPEGVMQEISFINFSGLDISQEFLFVFSLLAIVVTTVFSGLIIGLIGSGKERDGIKYIPILAIMALLIFLLSGSMIGSIFGTMLP